MVHLKTGFNLATNKMEVPGNLGNCFKITEIPCRTTTDMFEIRRDREGTVRKRIDWVSASK